MFKRKIETYLLDWKNQSTKKPLIIKGLRQVGKTSIVKKFAIENYSNVFFIDFRKNISAKKIFEGDFDIDNLTLLISMLPPSHQLIPNSKMIPHQTLIIFDELQDCPNARSSLKYFKEDGRYDIICTGSLLGIKGYHNKIENYRGIGVGSEDIIEMKSMDFEEFLWALNVEEAGINYIKDCYKNNKIINESIHLKFLNCFRMYLCVGGMPAVVDKYINTQDYSLIKKEQQSIIQNYISDFGVHIDDDNNITINEFEKSKILDVFNSIPHQLAKENTKFQYSVIKKGADGRTYKQAVSWLSDYGLINICHNLNNIDNPLDSYIIDDQFKVYFSDTGLLISMLDDDTAFNILNDTLTISKGMIYENAVSEMLVKNNNNLYYFSKSSGLEIDFITKINNEIFILEAKSKSGKTKSANEVLNNKNYHVNKMIKISSQNIGFINNKTTIPFYLGFAVLKNN